MTMKNLPWRLNDENIEDMSNSILKLNDIVSSLYKSNASKDIIKNLIDVHSDERISEL